MDFIAEKKDSKWTGMQAIRSHLESLGNGKYAIVIKRFRKRISDKQRSVWWIWLKTISDHTEHDVMELHVYLKLRFGKNVEYGRDGLPKPVSIMDNSTTDQNDLHESVRQWAFEFHGIRLEYLE